MAVPSRPPSPWWAGSALVSGPDGELRDRLVTDLGALGYAPLVHGGHDPPPVEPEPIIVLVADPAGIHASAQRTELLRTATHLQGVPLVWLVRPIDLSELFGHGHLVDDFIQVPYATEELAARLRLLRLRSAPEDQEIIRRGPLTMNVVTYQVSLGERALDLTYMEYELLKLFMGHPGRVYTREEILSRVWGYDYFGGMRTVDVHVRRLRAKLGQDHAWLIETVRSVGYRLAQVRG